MKEENKWFKLDNAAKIYPAFASKKDPATFRVAAVLKHDIDKDRLQEALEKTINDFPSMAVTLKKGLFWYYLDENPRPPLVMEETSMPCAYVELKKSRGYLFHVFYHKKRVSLECFHALTDGYGAFEFLKAILYNYFFVGEDDSIRLVGNRPEDVEDSYKKHAGLEYTEPKKTRAVHVKGRPIDREGAFVHHGVLSGSDLNKVAKSYNTTITVLLVAIYIKSIFKVTKKGPVVITVPVNLRKIFQSETLRNFSYVINVVCDQDDSIETLIPIISNQFKDQLDKEYLRGQFTKNVAYEKKLLLKIAPTDLKSVFLRMARNNQSKKIVTSILTNPGIVTLPEKMQTYVELLECVLYASNPHYINMGIATYNDKMVISMSRGIEEKTLIETFFNMLNDYCPLNMRYNNEGDQDGISSIQR